VRCELSRNLPYRQISQSSWRFSPRLNPSFGKSNSGELPREGQPKEERSWEAVSSFERSRSVDFELALILSTQIFSTHRFEIVTKSAMWRACLFRAISCL
jgi:hypothetical protein